MQMRRCTRRRVAAGLTALVALLCAACSATPSGPQKVGGNTVVTMWSWLSASDAQVWGQVINEFNKANDNKGLHEQIKLLHRVADVGPERVAQVAGDILCRIRDDVQKWPRRGGCIG